jgi:hypothetical protein
VTVRRDLLEHTVEATLAGYRPARAVVRVDKTVALSFVMPLQAAPAPPPPPPQPIEKPAEPAAKPAAPAAPAGPVAKRATSKRGR